eukprot:COSAG02_NODE_42504_length_384_cov_0.547368_1_plen_50_part_01
MLVLLPVSEDEDLAWAAVHDACKNAPCGVHGACMDLKAEPSDAEPLYSCV